MTEGRYPPPNPYVGARAFRQGEKLYGREREVTDLLYLLVAQRIVLLYSPSGAGKSSLIHAGLAPRLEKRKFDILPTMRVNLEPPRDIDLPPGTNRYVLSLLLCLEGEAEEEEKGAGSIDPQELEHLAGMTLAKYLQHRLGDSGSDRVVLIFDQFEEILTVDPMDLEAKVEFFRQVGEALQDRRCWALFAMREDYVAALDRYKRAVPTQLNITFRLDLLGREAALLAIQEPARETGVDFGQVAAERLVDNLRQERIQQPDGTMLERPGPYVEPVQLQVVCRWLWEKKFHPSAALEKPPAVALRIVEADLKAVGDVNQALAGYYGDQVAAVADRTRVHERDIRHWFEHHLITQQGFRGLVLREPERSGDLDNRAIPPLVDVYLVREVKRRGVTWYELVHDRFIKPIQESNARWRAARQARRLRILIPIAAALFLVLVSAAVGWLAANVVATERQQSQTQVAAGETQVAAIQTESQTQVAATVTDLALTATVDAAETASASATQEVFAKVQDLQTTKSGAEQDYSGYDLSGLDLSKVDLRRAILRVTNFMGTILIEATLTEANLTRANLGQADLSRAVLRNAPMDEVDLRGAKLVCTSFRGASLKEAKLDDKWAAIADLLTSVNGAGQDLSGADLSQAGLDGAVFVESDLAKANLDEACLNSADLSKAILVDARLGGAKLSQAMLAEADLSQARREGASLLQANLQGADLSDANLKGAFLEGADLRGADLTGAILADASGLETVIYDGETRWPAGFVPPGGTFVATETPTATPPPLPVPPTDTPTPTDTPITGITPEGTDTPTWTPSPTPTPTPTPTSTPIPTSTPTPRPTPPADLQIVFVSTRQGGSNLFLMGSSGEGPSVERPAEWIPLVPCHVFFEGCFEAGQPQFRTGTRQFVFHSRVPKKDVAVRPNDIFRATLGVDEAVVEKNLTEAPWDQMEGTWSPDGRRIAYLSTEEDLNRIWIMDSDGRNPEPLTSGEIYKDEQPAWSPSGDWIAITSQRLGSDAWEIWLVDPNDGENRRPVTKNGMVNRAPAWSPDGRRLVYARGPGEVEDICIINRNGTGEQCLPTPWKEDYPSWSPHGGWIAFDRYVDATFRTEVFVMRDDLTEPVRLTYNEADDWGPVWVSQR
ncbi:MAG TPA: pentapeptide repeat-containing protein [Anaerolineae bacterium]|nr:pentapeptide repeat-containing protein [Anaerolineae bacterium]